VRNLNIAIISQNHEQSFFITNFIKHHFANSRFLRSLRESEENEN